MKKIFQKLGVFVLLIATACKLDGDVQDPNNVTVAGADVDLIMNSVQLNFADLMSAADGTGAPLVRMQAMTGGYRYQTAYQPQGQDGLWRTAYRGVLANVRTMYPLAEAKNLTTHIAVGKILEAYTWLTLVDIYGDIPQVESLEAASGPDAWNPNITTGSDIYAYAIGLLNEARTQLAKTGSEAGAGLGRDIYYSGNRTRWNALANTLELKAWVNISQIPARKAEANAKIATFIDPTGAAIKDIVDKEGEDFRYKYGTVAVPAGSRHPWYDQYYGVNAGTAGGYVGTYFMYQMYNGSDYTNNGVGTGTPIQDPRWRYYFYRQVGSIIPTTNGFDPKALGCTQGAPPPHYVAAGFGVGKFCVFDPGFYGRDHGDASGTPPDGSVITCAGIYPAGGRPDNTPTALTSYQGGAKRGDGANGQGIQPIWMYFYTQFLVSEILARNGNNSDAQSKLIEGVSNSISYVKKFADSRKQSVTASPWSSNSWTSAPVPGDNCASLAPASSSIPPSPAYLQCLFNKMVQDYLTAVSLAYVNSTTKTDIIGKEFYKALWGNGLEAFNLYRRTSAPRNMQPLLQVSNDPYFRSIVYPAVYANLNKSATQKNVNVVNKVFWDNNPDNLN